VRDRLYRSDEVCQILGISKATLQRYRDHARIGFIQVGRKTLYRWQDIEALIEKSAQQSA